MSGQHEGSDTGGRREETGGGRKREKEETWPSKRTIFAFTCRPLPADLDLTLARTSAMDLIIIRGYTKWRPQIDFDARLNGVNAPLEELESSSTLTVKLLMTER